MADEIRNTIFENRMKNLLYIILCITIVSLFACSSKCEELIFSTNSLEDLYDCENTRYEMNIIPTGITTKIIKNQAQFDTIVSGRCQPAIDFATYDLIIGRHIASRQVDSIFYLYQIECPVDAKLLNVEFHLSANTMADTLIYHVLVPKLSEKDDFRVRVRSF
jgi:hypothetical protein